MSGHQNTEIQQITYRMISGVEGRCDGREGFTFDKSHADLFLFGKFSFLCKTNSMFKSNFLSSQHHVLRGTTFYHCLLCWCKFGIYTFFSCHFCVSTCAISLHAVIGFAFHMLTSNLLQLTGVNNPLDYYFAGEKYSIYSHFYLIDFY